MGSWEVPPEQHLAVVAVLEAAGDRAPQDAHASPPRKERAGQSKRAEPRVTAGAVAAA